MRALSYWPSIVWWFRRKSRHRSPDRCRSASAVVVGVAGLLSLFAGGVSPAEGATHRLISRSVPVDDLLEVEFKEDETHLYPLALEAGEYLYVEIVQRGIDLALTLQARDGSKLIEVDSPGGSYISERFGFLASAAGRFELIVRPTGGLRTRKYAIRIERSRATAQDLEYAEASLQLSAAEALRREGHRHSLDRALLLYRKNRKAWRRLGERLEEAITLCRAAQTWKALRKHRAEEIDRLETALRIIDEEITTSGTSTDLIAIKTDLLLRLGRTYRHNIQPAQAQQASEEALRLARTLGDRSLQALALNNLALVLRYRGDLETAVDYYAGANDIFRELENWTKVIISLRNIGYNNTLLGKFDDAEDAFQEALGVSYEVGDLGFAAAATAGLGWVRFVRGEPERALEYYARAIDQARRSGNLVRIAEVYSRQGRAYLAMGRYEKAEESHLEASIAFRNLNLPIDEHTEMANLGRVYQAQGNSEKFLEYLRRALPVIREAQKWDGVIHCLLTMSKAERQLGRLGQARALIEDALDILEFLRSTTFSPAFRLSLLEPRQNFYDHYVQVLMDLGEDQAAFAAAERARGRLLLELLGESLVKVRNNAPQELLDRERELWDAIAKLKSGSSSLNRKVDIKRRRLVRRYESLQGEIFSRNSAYRALLRPKPLDLRQFQRTKIDDATVMLVYFLGEEKSYLWRVTHEEFESYVLPARRKIESAAQRFHKLLASSHQNETEGVVRALSLRLSRMLLGEAYEDIGSQRLVIVADGALHYVPFAALASPTDGSPLVLHHEIVMLPSVSSLDNLRRGPMHSPRTWSVAVLADPVLDADDVRLRTVPTPPVEPSGEYARLLYSREEAEAILALVGPERGFMALDFDASRELVLSGRLREYDVLHLATHGYLSSDHPELSGIVLSKFDEQGRETPRDGLLSLHDIYGLDLPAELVVLSACRTALGQEVRGEGLVGLTRGFMYAGAPRVVVSLWDVNDRATAELMKRFYKAMLLDGKPPAAALRVAQVSMLEEPRFRKPIFWASFVLQGDWQ